MSQLTGKVALVTGGGSGIGLAIAARLASAGARVAISGRRREALDAAVASMTSEGLEALAVAGDVKSSEDANSMVEETVSTWGGLHILVNNAGVAPGGPLASMTDADIDAVVDVDLKGPIRVTRAALPHLQSHRDEGGASVINISSSVTHSVVANYSVYSAAKAGVDQLTRCWALDFAADRVRVNAICPGIVDTPIFETMMPEAAARRFVRQAASMTPLGRAGRPEDIAGLALFLAGPESEWMTGAVITLDGGISLGAPAS